MTAGLDHLEGEEVFIVADGALHPNKTVSSGAVTFDYAVKNVHIGLFRESRIRTMKIPTSNDYGTNQGQTKRINKLTVRFFRTLLAKISAQEDGGNEFSIDFIDSDYKAGSAPPLFTGDKSIPAFGSYTGISGLSRINHCHLQYSLSFHMYRYKEL